METKNFLLQNSMKRLVLRDCVKLLLRGQEELVEDHLVNVKGEVLRALFWNHLVKRKKAVRKTNLQLTSHQRLPAGFLADPPVES